MTEIINTKSSNIEKIKQMIECPKLYLINYFDEVKSQIDLSFVKSRNSLKDEKAIQESSNKWLKLIDIIDKCQAKCINNKLPNDIIDKTIKQLDTIESKQTVEDLHLLQKRFKRSFNQQNDKDIELEDQILAIRNKLESFLLANDSYLVSRNLEYENQILLVEEGFSQLEIEK